MLEYAFALNYYLNGHGNKLQLDVTFLESNDEDVSQFDAYPGVPGGFAGDNSAILLRFQWQLAL